MNIPTGSTLRVFKLLRRKCYLRNDICKWLDPLVFSDEDDKPLALRQTHSMFITRWDCPWALSINV